MKSANNKVNPFYAIKHEYIKLPEGIMPWGPTWSPDGRHILFHDYNGGFEWIVDEDRKTLKCITRNMKGRPDFIGGFYYILDDKRMFLSNELGDTAYILECEPSVYDAENFQWMPIDFTADSISGKPVLGRRTLHISPDGEHLAYNLLRFDGLIMVLCKLNRKEKNYVTTDYRVLNPHGPKSADDRDQEGWANSGTLSEFKTFAEGGKSMLYVSQSTGGNIDQFKRNLITGEITRLTFHDDWDEDGAMAPDGESIVCASWRTMNQLNVLSQVSVTPTFLCQYIGAALAVNYVSSQPGFACDLQPWLLSGNGDTAGKRMGQPIAPYRGEKNIAVNNIAGQPFWSPDSTKILLQERTIEKTSNNVNERVLEKGAAPNRIMIAHISRSPTQPLPIVKTSVGEWAIPLNEYRGNTDFQGVHEIDGYKSGKAILTIDGNFIDGNFKVEYLNFANDDQYVINGIESVIGSVKDLRWKTELRVTDKSGEIVGSINGDLRFRKKQVVLPRNIPPMFITGDITSTWNGVTLSGMPGLGAMTNIFPKPSPLILHVGIAHENGDRWLKVRLSADVYGDMRPVSGACVRAFDKDVITDDDGLAEFCFSKQLRGKILITAMAGDTFLSAFTELYL